MVKHIVSFKLRGTDKERREAAEKFAEALMSLPSQIEVLKSMEVVLTAVVPTMADVEVYAKHPAHVAAAGIIAPLRESRACIDYTFD